jgi:L-alanine-DL-glutamate epimerase-like enolase superfamily enzyme
MRITAVDVQVVEPGMQTIIAERLILNLSNVVVRLRTDEGIEGVAGSTTYLGANAAASAVAELRPLLVGEDPLYRERLWNRLNEVSTIVLPPHSIAVLDCALWDLAGKAAGLPVYKVIGAQRDRVRAYASTLTYEDVSTFEREVSAVLERGFRAVKLHVWGDPERDIELAERIRLLAGPGIALMVDAVGSYDVPAALRVGRRLEELGYEWFEMPIRDQFVQGYEILAAALDIPVTSGEVHTYTFQEAGNYIVRKAWDIVRVDAGISGGITGTRKTAALAEAFGMRCEIHSFGYALAQAANLQVMGAVKNCRYFEYPMPLNGYDQGMLDRIVVDPEGDVSVPQKPGIGLDVDWEQMDAMTTARY